MLVVKLGLQGPNYDITARLLSALANIAGRVLLRKGRVSKLTCLGALPASVFVVLGDFVNVHMRAISHLLKLQIVDARFDQGRLKCYIWCCSVQALP